MIKSKNEGFEQTHPPECVSVILELFLGGAETRSRVVRSAGMVGRGCPARRENLQVICDEKVSEWSVFSTIGSYVELCGLKPPNFLFISMFVFSLW